MTLEPLLAALEEVDPGAVARRVDLRRISRWQIGGMVEALYEPSSASALGRFLKLVADYSAPIAVVGDTANMLFDSRGFDGVLIRVGQNLSQIRVESRRLWAGAGASALSVAREAERSALSGLEHIVGIPGTVGGLIAMNGGTMRRGIGERVTEVHGLTRDGEPNTFTNQQCEFGYRSSKFQQTDITIVGAWLELEGGESSVIAASHEAILESRRGRFPQHLPNCGSTFASDPKAYAEFGTPGKMIEDAGLKGYKVGGAQFSEHHANFIVNLGEASSLDVLSLMDIARVRVAQMTGHMLRSEVRYLSPEGRNMPADEAVKELVKRPT